MHSGTGLTPGWGPKVLHAVQHGLNERILKNLKKEEILQTEEEVI